MGTMSVRTRIKIYSFNAKSLQTTKLFSVVVTYRLGIKFCRRQNDFLFFSLMTSRIKE